MYTSVSGAAYDCTVSNSRDSNCVIYFLLGIIGSIIILYRETKVSMAHNHQTLLIRSQKSSNPVCYLYIILVSCFSNIDVFKFMFYKFIINEQKFADYYK